MGVGHSAARRRASTMEIVVQGGCADLGGLPGCSRRRRRDAVQPEPVHALRGILRRRGSLARRPCGVRRRDVQGCGCTSWLADGHRGARLGAVRECCLGSRDDVLLQRLSSERARSASWSRRCPQSPCSLGELAAARARHQRHRRSARRAHSDGHADR